MSIIEARKELEIAIDMVRARSRVTVPVTQDTLRIGTKTASVVNVDPSRAPDTSLVPSSKGKSCDRDDIQADIEEVHGGKCRGQRDRYAHGNNQCHPPAPHEQKQDEDHNHQCNESRLREVTDGALDKLTLIAENLGRDTFRQD